MEIHMSEIKLGLERIYNLLDKLDNPQDKLQCIHIAGTNGKGSVGAYLEEIMCHFGKKVGRYASPAVFEPMEIIRVSKKNILYDDYDNRIKKLRQMDKDATLFELESALAFWYFYEKQCDICIIETGLGGRMDATNVIKNPLCVIFTSISMDHMNFLGSTLASIAYEKCGIIKKNTKVITGVQDKIVLDVIKDTCKKMNSQLLIADTSEVYDVDMSLDSTKFSYLASEYMITMLGKHQIENAIIAIKTSLSLDISKDIIYDGIMNTIWRGRLELINKNPIMILDGAHNEKAAYNLCKSLEYYFKDKNILYVCGVLKDKEYDKMLKIMSKISNQIITFKPNNDRGLDSSTLCKVAKKYYKYVYDAGNIDKAISISLQVARNNGCKNNDINEKNNINQIDIDKYLYKNEFINEKILKDDFAKFSNKETIIVIFGSLSFMKEILMKEI